MKNTKYRIVLLLVFLVFTLTCISFGGRIKVAYFDFTANSFNELLKGIFPELVDAQFKGDVVNEGQYTLITRNSETLASLLSENELEESGLVSPDTIHQLQLLGISYEMIFDFINAESGNVPTSSNQYSVSFTANGYFRVVSTSDGQIVAATSLNVESIGNGFSEKEALDNAETAVAQEMAAQMYNELIRFALIEGIVEKQVSTNEFLINKGSIDGVNSGMKFNFYNTLYGVPILSGSAEAVNVGSTASIIQVIEPPSTAVYIGITGVREIPARPLKVTGVSQSTNTNSPNLFNFNSTINKDIMMVIILIIVIIAGSMGLIPPS